MLELVSRAGEVPGQFSRPEVLRIFRLSSRQLSAWERAGLIAPRLVYTFTDLASLKTLCTLRAQGATASAIRHLIAAMKNLGDPYTDATLIQAGPGFAFRFEGSIIDPVRRQWVFDFDRIQPERQAPIPIGSSALHRADIQERVETQFSCAVNAEKAGEPKQAAHLYEEILDIDPEFAAAYINLGTLFYHQRQFARAEQFYRRAAEIDPEYTMAHFDLGNVLDELKRPEEAIAAYRRALEITPGYADAHYNLGLAYETIGELRLALHHFQQYVRLDTAGLWNRLARERIHGLIGREFLSVTWRGHGSLSRTPNASPLQLV